MEYFIIESRYEMRTLNGVELTKWFPLNTEKMTKEEAKDKIKEYKDSFEYIDKKTKLNHEYRIASYDEYIDNRNKLLKNIEVLSKKQEEYKNSDEYKELRKKIRQSAKERKERQAKYLEEHSV